MPLQGMSLSEMKKQEAQRKEKQEQEVEVVSNLETTLPMSSQDSRQSMKQVSDLSTEDRLKLLEDVVQSQKVKQSELIYTAELTQRTIKNLSEQLEKYNKSLDSTVSKVEKISENTSKNLLESTKQVVSELQKQLKEWESASRQGQKQNENLISAVQQKVLSIQTSNETVKEELTKTMAVMSDNHIEAVRKETASSLDPAVQELKKKSDEAIAEREERAEKLDKKMSSCISSMKQATEKGAQVNDSLKKSFRRTSTTLAFTMVICAVIIFFGGKMLFEIYKPIQRLDQATQSVVALKENVEAVGTQLAVQYNKIDGQSMERARIFALWNKKDYLGAVLAWIGVYWSEAIVCIEVIIALVYLIYKARESR